MPSLSEIIVGTARLRPIRIQPTTGGVVAELTGPGALPLIDATFDGDAQVELWTAGRSPRAMTVTGITMAGATTRVTLTDTHARIAVN
ncbi:hypothetical protein [Gemmobacter sp.]|uniref:hypothetical protein n=1 Tax=Gemmobacter sp. TaxID=1898957 RepID=UPI002AFE0915|nr:hypothetical protein [Gemmobacter sp.]